MMPAARCSLHGANSYARPGKQNLRTRLLGHGIVPTPAHSLPRGVHAFLLGLKTVYVGQRLQNSVCPSPPRPYLTRGKHLLHHCVYQLGGTHVLRNLPVGSYPTRRAGVLHVWGCDAWK